MKPSPFAEIIAAKGKSGARGAYSVCSAHRMVIDAALARARDGGFPVLIEATANQVNQFGGYTGLKPADFAGRLRSRMAELRVPAERVVFGGDHLGPFPWRKLPAAEAMENAKTLVREFACAGAGKIHLDASMALGGDPPGLLDPVIATERAAALCAEAEAAVASASAAGARPGARPVYVIGTEVPVPGGAAGDEGGAGPEPTKPEALLETVRAHREAFRARGLGEAWERVVAVVTQPGVEFDARRVYAYDRERARALRDAGLSLPDMVLEGHSTDYQGDLSLRALVEDGVAILKVGPALTFALRAAIFGLSWAAMELGFGNDGGKPALQSTLEKAMREDPAAWKGYCDEGDRVGLLYGLSDRVRYYWDDPRVDAEVKALLAFSGGRGVPLPLLHQFVPGYDLPGGAVAPGRFDPAGMIGSVIDRELARYERACDPESHTE